MAFAYEIPHCILILKLNLKHLNGDCALPPCGLEDDSIPSFRNLFAEFELLERYLHGCIEGASVDGLGQIKLALLLCLYLDIFLVFVAE